MIVWGAVKSSGEKVLVKFEVNVNWEKYIAVLKVPLLPFMVQQDNALPHSAQRTQIFFRKVVLKFWKTRHHSPQTCASLKEEKSCEKTFKKRGRALGKCSS